MKPLNVLSLFDGMSCGQIALDRLGIPVKNYFASEIDPYAMKIAKKNYPETIHVGDVTKVDSKDLPNIDLLIGGSPCQGFSFAGKQLNFEDERSKLFFEFVRLLKETKPKYFLLENVKMKKESQDIITKYLGVEPVEINSSLVSAQNRRRLYWTNLVVGKVSDTQTVLKDILEDSPDNTVFMSNTFKERFERYGKSFLSGNEDKAKCLAVREYEKNGRQGNYLDTTKLLFVGGVESGKRLESDKNLSRNYREGSRVYSSEGKAAALSASSKGGVGGFTGLYKNKSDIRKLTPIECERLQTVPDNYTEGTSDFKMSNTQRYKMLGNGWTVDVISHIFKMIPILENVSPEWSEL
tara:strand:+ start:89 stop:1144 length:1056 start_codon:yes stop_codon:yes gene_type:complete